MASARLRGNIIIFLQDGSARLDKKEDNTNSITGFFHPLYTKEWQRPSLNNLAFDSIGEEEASWLEREFEEEEIREAVFKMCGENALGLGGFPIFFVQRFWHDLKEEVMA